MHNSYLRVGGVIFWLALLLAPLLLVPTETRTAQINDLRLRLEYADDNDERVRGLSGRESLPKDTGLLFVFDEPRRYGFWMKDMNFAIDILWLDSDYRVVHVVRNAQPEGSRPTRTYSPSVPAQYVLEVNAGLAERYNINSGDVLHL